MDSNLSDVWVSVDDALQEFEPRFRLVLAALDEREGRSYLDAEDARGAALILRDAWATFRRELEELSCEPSDPPPAEAAEAAAARPWGALELAAEASEAVTVQLTPDEHDALQLIADVAKRSIEEEVRERLELDDVLAEARRIHAAVRGGAA